MIDNDTWLTMPDGSSIHFFLALDGSYHLSIIGPRDRTIYTQSLTSDEAIKLTSFLTSHIWNKS